MENNNATWQDRFELTTCPASGISSAIPPGAQGVAVIYRRIATEEKILLVLESRTGGLCKLCEKRLQSGKLPPVEQLTVAFKGEPFSDSSAEGIKTSCREQIVFAGELRRELRPAMR